MQWRNTTDRYGLVAQALHWVIVVGIVVQYFLAEAAEEGAGAAVEPFSAAGMHAALGMTLLILAALRLVWRVIELPPVRPATLKSYEISVARAVHVAFYVLLFAVPLTGWALATAEGPGPSILGWFDLPQFRPVTHAPLPGITGGSLSEHQLEELHEILFNMLLALAILHIAAALKHQFIDRDSTLRSMLPGRRRDPRNASQGRAR